MALIPKLRAMELIDSHEARPRGWYSGAMGYVRPDGSADFNVLIRTLFGHAPLGFVAALGGQCVDPCGRPRCRMGRVPA